MSPEVTPTTVDLRRSPELAADDQQRVVQLDTLIEVFNQRCHRPVTLYARLPDIESSTVCHSAQSRHFTAASHVGAINAGNVTALMTECSTNQVSADRST